MDGDFLDTTKSDTIKTDGTTMDGTTTDGTKTDFVTVDVVKETGGGETSGSDVNFDVKGTQDCCSTSSSPGCIDTAIQKCVCAQDSYCCQTGWDGTCVSEVNEFGCGTCTTTDGGSSDGGMPGDGGSTEIGPPMDGGGANDAWSKALGSQNCCLQSSTPGCVDAKIQACVCAVDSYCCTNHWDGICTGEVNSKSCGVCEGADGGSTDAGTMDGGKVDAGTTDSGFKDLPPPPMPDGG